MRAGAQRRPGGSDQSRYRAGGKAGDGAVDRPRAPRSGGEEVELASCPGRGAAFLRCSAEPEPIGGWIRWTPDQQRTADALRSIRGTSREHAKNLRKHAVIDRPVRHHLATPRVVTPRP